MVRGIIFHIFNLSNIIWSNILFWINLAWRSMSRIIMLSLVDIVNQLPGIHLLLCLQLRDIRTLRSRILVAPLRFHIFRLYHFIIFFLRSSFTTFGISFLISLPSRIPRCHIGSIHALLSPVLFNDEGVIGGRLQIICIFPCLIEF